MGYNVPTDKSAGNVANGVMQSALDIATGGVNEIDLILKDIQGGVRAADGANDGVNAILGDSTVCPWNGTTHVAGTYVNNDADGKLESGREVLDQYSITGTVDIKTAAGAMVIDDLMQKISTKVQVAAQLLSTANNIAKTASRIMSQG